MLVKEIFGFSFSWGYIWFPIIGVILELIVFEISIHMSKDVIEMEWDHNIDFSICISEFF